MTGAKTVADRLLDAPRVLRHFKKHVFPARHSVALLRWTGEYSHGAFHLVAVHQHLTRIALSTRGPQGQILIREHADRSTEWMKAIAGGEKHTVALRTDGTLWASAANNNVQLGVGTFNLWRSNSPTSALVTNAPQRVGTDTSWGPPP